MLRKLPLIAILAAFPPLATDMYLPAIPMLGVQWDIALSTINLSLVLFFVSFSLFLLIHGPLSDRFGRRPILLLGIAIFVLSSLLCALAGNVYVLIGYRIFQGAGAAAASALSMAICKDLFSGKEREQVLAYVAVIVAISPTVAPIIGGLILKWFSWPWIFVVQGALGFIAMIGVYFMQEPLQNFNQVNLLQLMGRYGSLFRNHRYMAYNVFMGLSMLPVFTFIAGSGDIYINGFGLSEQTFGYFFAFNALALMGGSFTCARLVRLMAGKKIMTGAFAGILIGGLMLMFSGKQGPWGVAIPMFVITYCIGLGRPPSNNLVLEQVQHDIGAASAFMVFTYFVMGACGMWLISLDWHNKIQVLAAIAIGSGGLILWGFRQLQQGDAA